MTLIPEGEEKLLPDVVRDEIAKAVAHAAKQLGLTRANEREVKVLAELGNDVAQFVAWKARQCCPPN